MKRKTILVFITLYLLTSCVGCGNQTQQDMSVESPAQSYSEPDKPVDDKPMSNKPESDKPVDDKPMSNKPESGKPIDNKPISNKPESGKPVHDKPKSGKSVDDLHVNPQNGDKLFEISKLNGTVTEFSDNGCKISPVISKGNEACGAAPGHEDPKKLITVTYDEGCSFQIAYANLKTEKITYDDADVNDVKKRTELLICGEYDSDNTLNASHVFIYRLQK